MMTIVCPGIYRWSKKVQMRCYSYTSTSFATLVVAGDVATGKTSAAGADGCPSPCPSEAKE